MFLFIIYLPREKSQLPNVIFWFLYQNYVLPDFFLTPLYQTQYITFSECFTLSVPRPTNTIFLWHLRQHLSRYKNTHRHIPLILSQKNYGESGEKNCLFHKGTEGFLTRSCDVETLVLIGDYLGSVMKKKIHYHPSPAY